MSYKDLREFIEQLDAIGELTRVDGVDWNEEAGAVFALSKGSVLMDRFPGYPPGYRLLACPILHQKKIEGPAVFFLATNWSTEQRGMGLTRAWLERLREFKPVPPRVVKTGPIMQNVATGSKVNVLKFPVPKWHEDDGGRFIGTAGIQIVRDPETNRVNFGTYRMQVHDKASLGIHMSDGKDGDIIMHKYFKQGKPCPFVGVFGCDPALLLAGGGRTTHVEGDSEYDFAGWLRGMPEEVIIGKYTGIPIPANAEIAIEGEIRPGDTLPEGPFGEGSGYSEVRDFPVVRVKAVYHRNDPIMTGQMPLAYPPGRGDLKDNFQYSALIWDQMEKTGVREIKGVACYFGNRLIVVSIRNSFAGHSRQAGLIASQCHTGNYQGNWVIVVDERIDPTCLNDVMWQIVMRTDAKRAIQVLDYLWASHQSFFDPSRAFAKADYPMMPSKAVYRSGAIIDACVPIEQDPSWHRDVRISPALRDRVMKKFPGIRS